MMKLLTILALSWAVLGFTNEELTPGVYKENLGECGVIASHWKLLIKLDLNLINKKLEEVYILRHNIGLCCKKNKINCDQFITLSDKMLQKANMAKENLKMLLKNKNKRGLMNIVGSAANFMFGTLSQDDKDEIEDQIKNIRDHSEKDFLKKQTKILASTLVELTDNRDMINNHTQIIRELVIKENKEIDFQQSNIMALRLENIFKIYDLVSDEIFNIERAIVDMQHGILNPNIISYQKIIDELKEIFIHYPTNNVLPVDLNNPNISLLIKIITMGMEWKIIFYFS